MSLSDGETTKRRKPLRTLVCPRCGNVGLKKILYGMPMSDFDQEKYIMGGCVISGFDPEIGCTSCGWEGMRGKCS